MLRELFTKSATAIAAGAVALSVALSSAANGKVFFKNADNLPPRGQGVVVAAQSTGRVAVIVRSTNPEFRDAILTSAHLLSDMFKNKFGRDIEIGVTYGTDPDGGNPRNIKVSVYANGEPTNYAFTVNDFDPSADRDAVVNYTFKKLVGAYREHIQPLQVAQARTPAAPATN